MDHLTADTHLVESLLWIPGALLYLPIGILAAVVALELVDGVQGSRHNERSILALIVFGLVTTFFATHLGVVTRIFLGDWGFFPFRELLPGYVLGFALLLTWAVKFSSRRSWGKTSEMATHNAMTKHRSSGSRLLTGAYRLLLVVCLFLAAFCVRFEASFGEVPAYVTLGFPGRVSEMPAPPEPVAPPVPTAVAQVAPEVVEPEPEEAMEPEEMEEPEEEPPSEPQPQPVPKMAASATVVAAELPDGLTVDFVTQVEPLLKKHCYECHGEAKDKGDLRVHTPVAIRTGGGDGPVVVTGKPEDSSLYFLTTLDPMDEDIMPSKGDTLTKEEQEVLRVWIMEGAYLPDGLSAGDTSDAAMGPGGEAEGEDEELPISKYVVIPNDTYLDSLRANGIVVEEVPDTEFMLSFDYTESKKNAGEIDLKKLYPLARNVHTLNLTRVPVNEKDLEALDEFTNLVNLELGRTNIGDGALDHVVGMEKLESINLFATRITDYSVRYLEDLPNLKKIVVFNTQVTVEAANRLRKKFPDAEVQAPE